MMPLGDKIKLLIFLLFIHSISRNTKILDREIGYWADQIPVTNAALCAVIDPIRDYRWHSLRCGGPEISSFLCEMEGLLIVSSHHLKQSN